MILSTLFERRSDLTHPSQWFTEWMGGLPTAAGVTVNEDTATRLPAVWACINVLAQSIAQVPLNLMLREGRGAEPAVNHPLYDILHNRPNNDMTSFTWREISQAHLASWGNAYSLIARNGRGDVTSLLPLLPDRTRPVIIRGETWYETVLENQSRQYPGTDILHIRGLGYDGMLGWSPIRMARETLGWTQATQEFSSRFFGQGAALKGVLKHPGTVRDKDKLREEWNRLYGSTTNAMKTAVLEQGMEYQSIGVPPEDAQFVETQKLQRSTIAMIFKVPQHFVGEPNTKYNNRELEAIDFVIYTLGSWVQRWEQEMNTKLLRIGERKTLFTKFNLMGYLRGDSQARSAFFTQAITNGWMTPNEVRELEDMNPLPGLDTPLRPLNMTPVGATLQPKATPQADDAQPDKMPDQARSIVRAAVEIMRRKEEETLTRLHARHGEGTEFLHAVSDFFSNGHRRMLGETLALPDAAVREYLARRWNDIREAHDVQVAITATAGLAELVGV